MPQSLRQWIPNALTMARLVLAAGFFVLLAFFDPAAAAHGRIGADAAVGPVAAGGQGLWVLNFAAGLFIVAALTDFLDGHLARRWNAVTAFGRVMDPFCDKILVLGALIFLAGPSFVAIVGGPVADTAMGGLPAAGPAVPPPSPGAATAVSLTGIHPWMVVVILARELLVTSIRGVAESSGIAFGAVRAGKLKMILQSLTVPIVLLLIANFAPLETEWARWTRDALVFATVIVTIISGVPYVTRAVGAFQTASRVPPAAGR